MTRQKVVMHLHVGEACKLRLELAAETAIHTDEDVHWPCTVASYAGEAVSRGNCNDLHLKRARPAFQPILGQE